MVASIPVAGAERTWSKEVAPAPHAAARGGVGCPFEDRCPSALPVCGTSRPPLFRTAEHRVAACFLYDGSPTLPAAAMTETFVETPVEIEPASA
jgi:ABC-type dipeptide/oligopeptide/nickel transport system ATPase component